MWNQTSLNKTALVLWVFLRTDPFLCRVSTYKAGEKFYFDKGIAISECLKAWFTKMNRTAQRNKKQTSVWHHAHLLWSFYNTYMLIILFKAPYHRKGFQVASFNWFALRRFHLTDRNWEVGFYPRWYLCPLLTIFECHLCCPDLSNKHERIFSLYALCNVNNWLFLAYLRNSLQKKDT